MSEATVSAATSHLIRGISWFSLNNEAVANSVETLAGVTARKLSEKALWAYYAQQLKCSAGPLAIEVQ